MGLPCASPDGVVLDGLPPLLRGRIDHLERLAVSALARDRTIARLQFTALRPLLDIEFDYPLKERVGHVGTTGGCDDLLLVGRSVVLGVFPEQGG